MRRPMTGSFCLLAIAGSTAVGQTQDRAAEKSMRVVRTEAPPVIDGQLVEDIWGIADVVDDFYEVRPDEFEAPSQRTQVFVLYDQDYLYIAAKLWDEQPEGVTAQILRQGSNIDADDYFSVILDPFHDRRRGYLFQVNPNGVRTDAIYENTTQMQTNWEGIWEAGASVSEDGWVVEMAIHNQMRIILWPGLICVTSIHVSRAGAPWTETPGTREVTRRGSKASPQQ